MGLHDLVIGNVHYDVEFRTNDKKPYPYWEMYRTKNIKKIYIYNVSTIKDINETKEEAWRYFKNEQKQTNAGSEILQR